MFKSFVEKSDGKKAKLEVYIYIGLFVYTSRGGVVQDFFRVGKILQVEITVTINRNHGCKKIF